MQLFEYEAKALLERRGLRVPRGGLWPGYDPPTFPVVAKAQVAAGGRGRRGGIRQIASLEQLSATAEHLSAMLFDGHPVAAVLVEEWVPAARETYLALLVDRTRRSPVLLASATGGIDVEVGAPPLAQSIDPWIGPRPHHFRTVASRLGISPEDLAPVLDALWRTFLEEEALLVEINPLGLVPDGAPIAMDARIVLDDNARYRHGDWPHPRGTPFEVGCAALGASGVEVDPEGSIAIVASGAGLTMASLDVVVALGGRPQVVVDMGPVVFQQPEKVTDLMRLIWSLRPRIVLLNLFLQLARCDMIVRGVLPVLMEAPTTRSVVRIRGVGAGEARATLEPFSHVFENLEQAFHAAVQLARSR